MKTYKLSDFIKSSFVLVLSNLLLKSINFFLLPLYTVYLTPKLLGVSDSITNITSFLFPLLVLCMDSAYSAFYFDEDRQDFKEKIFFTTRQFLRLTSLLPVFGVLWSKNISYNLFGSHDYYLVVAFALLSVSVNLWLLPYLLELRMQNKMVIYSVIHLGSALLMILLNVVFLRYCKLGSLSLVLSLFISHCAQLLGLMLLFRKIKIKNKFDNSLLKQMLQFALPLLPTVVLAWVLNMSDRMILLHFCGADEVGIYGIGFRFANILNVIVSAVYTAYTPFAFSNKSNKRGKQAYRVTLHWLTAGLAIVALIAALFARELVTLMTTEAYFRSAYVIRDLIFSQVVFFMYTIISYGIHFAKQTKYVTYITFAGAATNILLNLWLIPNGGAQAAALTTIVSYFVMLILTAIISTKLYPYDYKLFELSTIFFVPYLGSILLESSRIVFKIIFVVLYILFLIILKKKELSIVLKLGRETIARMKKKE